VITMQSVGSLPGAAAEDWCEKHQERDGIQQGSGQAESKQPTGSFLLKNIEKHQQFSKSYRPCTTRR